MPTRKEELTINMFDGHDLVDLSNDRGKFLNSFYASLDTFEKAESEQGMDAALKQLKEIYPTDFLGVLMMFAQKHPNKIAIRLYQSMNT